MILYPSISLKDGQCVRVIQGNLEDLVVVNTDPVAQAQYFEEIGFSWLHIVDLDGVTNDQSRNRQVMDEILAAIKIPVQFGGGLRSAEDVSYWIDRGVMQVVVGTMALKDPDAMAAACRSFPGKVAAALDVKEGFVAVSGWAEVSKVKLLDFAIQLEKLGVAALIYTDVDRDGTQIGLNIDKAVDLAWAVTTPVIAHGGVASMEDLSMLRSESDSGLAGVIVGSSLYDGRIDPHAALRLFDPPDAA